MIPGMRSAYEPESSPSGTPIYDALYTEYRRLFRALPGDRSGEEHLRFTGFGLRRSYGVRQADHSSQGVRGPVGPEHTHGGQGYAAPHFAQGHAYGASAGSGQAGGGWTPVGHIPPSQPQSQAQAQGQGHGQAHGQSQGQSQAQAAGHGQGGRGQAAGGRHRSLLSLPPGRGWAARQ